MKKVALVLFFLTLIIGAYLFFPDKQYATNITLSEEIEDLSTDPTSITTLSPSVESSALKVVNEQEKQKFIATHIDTPKEVRAIYMSSWVAGTPSFRERLVKLIEETDINSVIIDIKDYTGKISFRIDDWSYASLNSTENRIPDLKGFIERLHSKGIYVIGRISVFQDPHLVSMWPKEAVKKSSDKEEVWKDHKGISWVDPGSEKVWQYTVELAKISYEYGFDEINFDYIRFPSDGNMKDIYYPISDGKIKKEVMKSFFEYLNVHLKGRGGLKISADLFGMTTTNTDDLGIGQVLEDALVNFDYVAPMVYPSHFPNNWAGMAKPAERPYDVIYRSMTSAVRRAEAIGEDPKKLRPWLQDFDLGAKYTKEMVRAQIKATYDSGLDSWMLWDPKNIYTKDALKDVLIETSNQEVVPEDKEEIII